MTQLVRYDSRRSGMPALFDWEPLRLFDDLFRLPSTPSPSVHETDDDLTITIDMPGLDRDDVDITLDRGTLSVSGTRADRVYRYSLSVGAAFDPDKIDATLDKGVLTIRAGKREAAKPRKIALTGASPKHLAAGQPKKKLFSRWLRR